MNRETALAQLRHLYAQMLNGSVKDLPEAARGLLGPAIAALEADERLAASEAIPKFEPGDRIYQIGPDDVETRGQMPLIVYTVLDQAGSIDSTNRFWLKARDNFGRETHIRPRAWASVEDLKL